MKKNEKWTESEFVFFVLAKKGKSTFALHFFHFERKSKLTASDAEMDMGWVHPWVGLGWVE